MSSLGTNGGTASASGNPEPAPRGDVRKIYKKRVKASASVGLAG